MKSKEIRRKFLEYFTSLNHTYVRSAPIVLKNDPTLMFTNAGMNQFKDYFLGHQKPPYPRAVNSQKCLRVSGKHNDLEEVGVDTYHHTMFEMLGNWSFGDYFKQDAIKWAWELLIKIYSIPPENLFITVFGGDEKDGLEKDQEAYDIWRQFVPEERILFCDKTDNFWEMGATGPCGPCSEIHVDLRSAADKQKVPGRQLVNKDHPQVIEIWNLVFMEFNRNADESLSNLPAKHVDTGMGFERLCMALQGKSSNYDTDVFSGLITKVEQLSGQTYGKSETIDTAIRVIVDHIRAVAFAIADGQLPANNGAGYVIRRILRRAVRYGYTYLDLQQAFLHKLMPVLIDYFEDSYPEIKEQGEFVEKVIHEEEQSFMKTLGSGLKRLAAIEAELKTDKKKEIPGPKAFELYDTYGFPYDLTALIARENGLSVDEAGFKAEMQQQKQRSKKAAQSSTGDWNIIRDVEKVEFLGYDELELKAQVSKFRVVEQKKKKQFQLVLDRTPFYAESGGQVGDKGLLSNGEEKIRVLDTIKENDLIIHITDKLPKDPEAEYHAVVNAEARAQTAANHSATHLIHSALRQVLGDHVEQRGSLVTPDYLRFDFSHFAKVEKEQIAEVEKIVNEKIREDIHKGENRSMKIEEAKKMGAMALFGEKYGDVVRVISFDPSYSVELCGGTHVERTGQIGCCIINTETSVAAGIRRVEALTGAKAIEYMQDRMRQLQEVRELLKPKGETAEAVQLLMDENNRLKKEQDKFLQAQAEQLKQQLESSVEEINGVQYLGKVIQAESADQIKTIAYGLNQKFPNVFVALGAEINGKGSLTVLIDKELAASKELNAGQIIREIAKEIQGGGGGQPFFATAGGKNPEGLDRAIAKTREIVLNLQ